MDDQAEPAEPTGLRSPAPAPSTPSETRNSLPPYAAAFSAFYRECVPTLVAFLVWQGAHLPDATDIA